MKKLTFPLLILVAFSACAQPAHLDKFYQKYHAKEDNKDGFDPGFLFTASFSGSHNSDDKDDNWLKKVTSVRCLIIDGKKAVDPTDEWNDLSASLRADHFEEWFSVRKGKGRVQLLSRDDRDNMEDIACVIVGDDGGGLFFHLRGHFTAADKARMEAALQEHDGE
jgi:Domain of unknown function (DUF4252)